MMMMILKSKKILNFIENIKFQTNLKWPWEIYIIEKKTIFKLQNAKFFL